MLAELEAIYKMGYRGHLDFVDDDFIGNKKSLRRLLPELAAWQRTHDYPFEFSTEASVNLAVDPELPKNDGRGQLLRHFRWHRKSGPGNPGRDEEEAEYVAQYR